MKINCNLSGDITDVCVILQGPLKLENNFTLETVKFYTKNVPEMFYCCINLGYGRCSSIEGIGKKWGNCSKK